MCSCGATDQAICPGCGISFPVPISNPPGLATIAYRQGDYSAFREALLLPRAGEVALTQTLGGVTTQVWRPGAQGDLAVQMVEWWAYLCDVLTYYNERVANQAYLRTADLPESVNGLIRLLGYRPRPGIGAFGTLGVLASGPAAFTIPQGLQIQNKPGPGSSPQIFEVISDVTITPPAGPPGTDAIQGTAAVQTPPVPATVGDGGNGAGLFVLAGNVSTMKVNDRVLILPVPNVTPAANAPTYVVATVVTLTPAKDPLGNPITNVVLAFVGGSVGTTASPPWAALGDITQYRLLRSDQSSQVWPYPAATSSVVRLTTQFLLVDLVTIVRTSRIGDPIVFEDATEAPTLTSTFGSLTASTEVVWYANPAGFNPADPTWAGVDPSVAPVAPTSPPNAPNPVSIAIPHTRITIPWTTSAPVDSSINRPYYLVRYGWKEVGPFVAIPSTTVGGLRSNSGAGQASSSTLTLNPSGSSSFPVPPKTSVLIEDVNGNGALGLVDNGSSMHVVGPVPLLVPPLRTLFNLVSVTRGKTVANEVLGSGNSMVPGQDFTLQNAPVTYLQDSLSVSGDGYSSTVQVWVNGLQWLETQSFYGQPANAQIFVTQEDDQGMTHVVFGDGVNGARLPTGVGNVVATYRYGSGATSPAAGSLTVVLQPRAGLRGVRNPLAVGGGSDPDPPAKVRTFAPRSVLTFGRAVSVDDYQAIASQATGVVRAMTSVSFDPVAQRPRVTVWVGDDDSAVQSARNALAAAADPNRLPRVLAAQAVLMNLSLTVVHDPRWQDQAIMAAVTTALLDPDQGLLGPNVVGIGQAIYDSQVYAACLAVPGVTAVHSLVFDVTNIYYPPIFILNPVLNRLASTSLAIDSNWLISARALVSTAPPSCSGRRHDPGEGAFLFLKNDPSTFNLTVEAGS